MIQTRIPSSTKIFGSSSKIEPQQTTLSVDRNYLQHRMTLLLGPPSSGKTTFLRALAGLLDSDLKVSGRITYCGHELNEFVPGRTCAYVSQNDLHYGEMTVRETLKFSTQCLGVGSRDNLLQELLKREKQLGFSPSSEVDSFLERLATKDEEISLVIEYMLKILGLDLCADTLVGDDLRRGISGGEKKRLTIGEMLVAPAKLLLLDEISTGLDSSTAFQICKCIREMVQIMDMTTIISLLQPTPEIFELFDDVILLSDGQIVYQGPCDQVLEFFENVGFKCPARKGVADFLQEVTSKTDQQQYWFKNQISYQYISVAELAEKFQSFHVGQKLGHDLKTLYAKDEVHPLALVKEKYGITNKELLKTCFSREWLLMKRNCLLYIFKSVQVMIIAIVTMSAFYRTRMHHNSVIDGEKYIAALFFGLANFVLNGMTETNLAIMRLPIYFKQRDLLFYPGWAYVLPVWILSIPSSLIESGLWTIITYFTIGYSPVATRFAYQWLTFFCIHQVALSLFRCVSALGRTLVIANTMGMILLLLTFVLSGFIIEKDAIAPWMMWAYYLSPIMYGQHALVINEFLDKRWSIPNTDPRIKEKTIGEVVIVSRGLFNHQYWFWISIGALLGFSLIFNVIYTIALTYLNPISDSKSIVEDDHNISPGNVFSCDDSSTLSHSTMQDAPLCLPFRPLSVTFNHINYYVDTPHEMKTLGFKEDHLKLLKDVSGAFRPGVLTALLGITGAGKTTLLDVLAGKKTSGYIEGSIKVSGYPKDQVTFARICGYCEQVDIHSPYVTVYDSLLYSAWLRLPPNIGFKTRNMFVEEVMNLMELQPIRDRIVGLPRVNGLSTEQRKRLTIAVELVANPSIIFMDEPTSGLDARAAAIVMRTIRNAVNSGKTVVCTIHQPSIQIFEAFDELLLMKRGGEIIYAGSLGNNCHTLIQYFEAIPGVPKIKDGYNPATWILDITDPMMESQLNVDFANIYVDSELYRKNQEIIKELSIPSLDSEDLCFSTKYSQPFIIQFKACFWKQYKSYWKNRSYSLVRFFLTIALGVLLGLIFWNKGSKLANQQELLNQFGILFSALLFLGGCNAFNVQMIAANERTTYYREKAAMMYSALPFALAQLAIEAMYLAIVNVVYCVLLYSMIGYEWTIGKFLLFYYFIFMCFTYYTTFGMMLVSLTPRPEFSSILMCFFLTLWNLFAGFFLPKTQIPIWWRWYYWASPVSWTMHGLVCSQVCDKDSLLEVPEVGNVPLKFFLKQVFDYDDNFLPFVVIAHVFWVFLFSFVFVCGINFLNFQKR
ncbi:ABC transporter G family member 39-like isoform X3 [Amaranthus tricolor]|uniref:ABC transporter G family member 39-like isoform X3 n=1 Tax=Amaranthus tricolor TaxID=29722 RepID=UPI0025868B0F|nr:ABC transporter G family member 39-like isoform X3 [Amaranthus tricolor]